MKSIIKFGQNTLIPRLSALLAIVLSLFLIWGLVLVRDKLLSNANSMGNHLAQSYASREESRFQYYESLVATCARVMNETMAEGASRDELVEILSKFSAHANAQIGHQAFDMYAVVDGKIVAATPWEGDDTYDYASTSWYQTGLIAHETMFTDIYTDVITGQHVVTLAQKLNGEGNVLATDIVLEKLPAAVSKDEMPEDSAYYLIDSDGMLLFKQSDLDLSSSEGSNYLRFLVEGVRDGAYCDPSATVTDLTGTTRGVYYFEMDNGWLSIITIPLDNILQDGWDSLFVVLSIICTATIVVLFIAIMRERLNRAKNREIAKTLRILGDRHYAIYQVNLSTERYRIIKWASDTPKDFPSQGWYSDLLLMMKDFVEESAYQDFVESFSMSNIQSLINKDVRDFGGDYQRRFGSSFKWVNVRSIYNRELSKNEFLLCFREIDSQKRAELQHLELIENALKTARRTESRKTEFFSKASHDMRTPLNAIIGISSLLKDHANDPETVKNDARKIERSGEQLLTLVNDILELSRMEAEDERSVDSKPLDLARCLSEAVETFQQKADDENKRLTVSGVNDPVPVFGDSLKLTRIFNNLISNALKYTNEGDSVFVSLRTISDGSTATKYQIVVSDTGIGMSESFLERLFEPFSRETRFAPANASGTGLGMPIVKTLVQRMSGEISVKSSLGKGTTFVVTLPLPPASSMAIKQKSATKSDVGSAKGPQPLAGMTVLVAEDNEISLELMLELLERMGARTIAASNGEEAFLKFSASSPKEIDAVLLDMHMPVMDGCQASEAIRALERDDARQVAIIAVTANAFAEDIARTTLAGMDGHLSKPIDPLSLGVSIASIVEKKRGL